jgi:DNA repair protein SbcD/Mre11
LKILCTADAHIGRRSSRLSPDADPRTHSAAEAWLRLADRAVHEGADLVLVAGDLVDRANRFFEAFGPLERGARRLAEAGIPVLMVAGNHDHSILPLLIDEIASPSVRLLGRGGEWERFTVERGSEKIHVDGWSFPAEHHPENPLSSYPFRADDGVPVVCMLHGDLEQTRSPYAPISLAEMRRHPQVTFVLGHLHQARSILEPAGARAFYPGSPQALDPGEPGSHGFLLLDVGPDNCQHRNVPLSTIRYEPLEVSLEGAERLEEVDARIAGAVRDAVRRHEEASGSVQSLRLRVRVVGRTPLHRQLDGRLVERVLELEVEMGDLRGSVESVQLATSSPRDLDSLQTGAGAPAVLAGLIQELKAGSSGGATERLLTRALAAAAEMERATPYLDVPARADGEGDLEETVREELQHAADLLLDELLAQKESSS